MSFVQSLFALLPIVLAQASSVEMLPTGEYYYESTGAGRPQYVLLRKAGRTVIGVDLQAIGEPVCFRGWLEGDAVVNATWMLPPYQPDSRLTHEDGVLLDLTSYRPATDTPSREERAALRSCIHFFWR
ncbi:MAG: hypothetical protein F6K28_50945 [Microcoleus sp. SIO2G3]|nr:hypothetical protein [Microcoleus sp. SIO2G3]